MSYLHTDMVQLCVCLVVTKEILNLPKNIKLILLTFLKILIFQQNLTLKKSMMSL